MRTEKIQAVIKELQLLANKNKITNVNDAARLEMLTFIAFSSDLIDTPIPVNYIDKSREYYERTSSLANKRKLNKLYDLMFYLNELVLKNQATKDLLQLAKERISNLIWNLEQFEYIEGTLLAENMLLNEEAAMEFAQEHLNSLSRTAAIEPYQNIATSSFDIGADGLLPLAAFDATIKAIAQVYCIEEIILLSDYSLDTLYKIALNGKKTIYNAIANKGEIREVKLQRLDEIFKDIEKVNPKNFEPTADQMTDIMRVTMKAIRDKQPLHSILDDAVKILQTEV